MRDIYSDVVYKNPGKARADNIFYSIMNNIPGLFNSIAVIDSTELSENGFYAAYQRQHAFHVKLKARLIPSSRNRFYEVYIVPNEYLS